MAPQHQQSKNTNNNTAGKGPITVNFIISEWVAREAFEDILKQTDIDSVAKEALFKEYYIAHRTGVPVNEKAVVIHHLAAKDWRWFEFEKFYDIFSASGKWPYMWRQYPSLYTKPDQQPENTKQALHYFTFKELKGIIKEHGLASKMPRSRVEAEKIVQDLDFSKIKQMTNGKHDKYLAKYAKTKREDKCRLLAHNIVTSMYSLGHHYKREQIQKGRKVEADVVQGCAIETEYADKFNRGELSGLPPFFPGDRTSLMLSK